uniref:Uncharacterized protein n=1 Tax=Stomoxys calcitrans TaxID=35570 RepID=A0A1I8P8R7_STOCA
MDPLLGRLAEFFKIYAYAEGLFILVEIDSRLALETRGELSMGIVREWSDRVGVDVASPPKIPLITTYHALLSQESDQPHKRPTLQRQDYSCLDSSEAQSDDSHLTRESITRESQNDELSSSTLDKIDVSTLPLPALPPKKRRTKLRASPSKHHSRRYGSPQHHQHSELRDPHSPADKGPPSKDDYQHLSAFQRYVAKRRESLEASSRSFNEKLEARRMHYHMGGSGGGSGASSSSGAGLHMPTYLFGEHYYAGSSRKTVAPANKEEIYLNKSGWVQVNTKRTNDENRGYRRSNYGHQNGDLRNTIRVIQIDNTRRSDMTRQALLQHQHAIVEPPKFVSSKVEELIQRNEARLGASNGRDSALRPGYRIVDPQLASILNERPGFLPVKNLNDHESPPPITPILSPPPAFQDSSVKAKSFDRRRTIASRPTPQPQTMVVNNCNLQASNVPNNKGMVFSRSFEYDNRRPTPTDTYVETFSRSFDGNLTERPAKPVAVARDRSPNFSTLTGNSPNYLSKKDSGGGSSGSLRSRDSSPKYQSPAASISSSQSPQTQKTTAYLNTSVKEAPPSYSVAGHTTSPVANKYSPRSQHHERSSFERSKSHNVVGRSRKSQFSRTGSGNIGGVSSGASVGGVIGGGPSNLNVSRFRSFDTPMSQRLNSCDSGARSDLSNDELDNDDDDAGSSEFLNTNSYHPSTSPFKSQRQRSLTPDRNESHSSSSSLRKQRSLTPESRSLTPEDRRKKGSQLSLMGSRQNSSSRSNTLERNREKVNISRSSSSSSYSGGEHDNHGVGVGGSAMNAGSSQYRRSVSRNAKQAEEHRIRRSRSLQLTERSPNRGHKMVVCVGQTHVNSNQPPIYQQANIRNNQMGTMPSNNFPPTIRTTGKSQSILLGASNGGAKVVRQSDIDKSRSFDFDYCNYNSQNNAMKSQHSSSSLLGSASVLNRDGGAMRLDFDKSRSFDDDYREATVVSNNNLNAAAMRYLQAAESTERSHQRMRRSSPVEGMGSGGGSGSRNTRSPQSSGSSCNNLSVPRQTTSPQNYGTRLCDHEMTYDLMRKSLDRSPIMEFRRGDSAGGGSSGGDYDIPLGMMRNRETINSGGNSELNFMNNDGRIYEHVGSNSLKQQRSLRRTHSPNETHYSLERSHATSSRDEMTPPDAGGDYRNEYNDMYRRTRSTNRGRDLHPTKSIANFHQPHGKTASHITATDRVVCSQNTAEAYCASLPRQCGACRHVSFDKQHDYLKSLPLKRRNQTKLCSSSTTTSPLPHGLKHSPSLNNFTPQSRDSEKAAAIRKSNISMVKVNVNSSCTALKHNEEGCKTNMGYVNIVAARQEGTEQNSTAAMKSGLSAMATNMRPSNNSSITQWTLLCRNATASCSSSISIGPGSNSSTSSSSLTPSKAASPAADAVDNKNNKVIDDDDGPFNTTTTTTSTTNTKLAANCRDAKQKPTLPSPKAKAKANAKRKSVAAAANEFTSTINKSEDNSVTLMTTMRIADSATSSGSNFSASSPSGSRSSRGSHGSGPTMLAATNGGIKKIPNNSNNISSKSNSNSSAKFSLTSNLLSSCKNNLKSLPSPPPSPMKLQNMQQHCQNVPQQHRQLERLSSASLPDICLDVDIENHHHNMG